MMVLSSFAVDLRVNISSKISVWGGEKMQGGGNSVSQCYSFYKWSCYIIAVLH